ncbi:MAG: IS30 family transposase, partial [Sediminicola sp.]
MNEVEKLINYRPIRKFNYNGSIETLKNKTVALIDS